MSANALRVPTPRINDVVRGRRGVSADTALGIAKKQKLGGPEWKVDCRRRGAVIDPGKDGHPCGTNGGLQTG